MSNVKLQVKKLDIKTGDKFIVDDFFKNGSYPPGTLGFINSVVVNPSSIFWIGVNTTIIRRGKGGKIRCEATQFKLPLFSTLDKNNSFADALRKHKEYASMGARIININKLPVDCKNITTIPSIDYIGWAYSAACFLSVIRSKYTDKLGRWPKTKTNPILEILNVTKEYAMLSATPETFFEVFAGVEKRKRFGYEYRKLEAINIKGIERYNKALDTYLISCLSHIAGDRKHTQYQKEMVNQATLLLKNLGDKK